MRRRTSLFVLVLLIIKFTLLSASADGRNENERNLGWHKRRDGGRKDRDGQHDRRDRRGKRTGPMNGCFQTNGNNNGNDDDGNGTTEPQDIFGRLLGWWSGKNSTGVPDGDDPFEMDFDCLNQHSGDSAIDDEDEDEGGGDQYEEVVSDDEGGHNTTGDDDEWEVSIDVTTTRVPTPAPTLSSIDQAFLDADRVSTIFCIISIGLPERVRYSAAKRLLKYVAIVIGEIVQFQTGGEFITVIDNDGSDDDREYYQRGGSQRRMRGDQLKLANHHHNSTNNNNNIIIKKYNKDEDKPNQRGLFERRQLRFNQHDSTVEFMPLNITDEAWWKYVPAFDTIEENVTAVERTVYSAVMAAVQRGKFERRLKEYFKKVKGVRVPGTEGMPLSENSEGDDENTTSEEGKSPTISSAQQEDMLVNGWDTQQWVGLILFGSTIVYVVFVTLTARRRRRKMEEEKTWGVRFSGEDGIDELLQYGWRKHCDGTHFQVYHRAYPRRDDDSLLPGGPQPDMTLPSSIITSRAPLRIQQFSSKSFVGTDRTSFSAGSSPSSEAGQQPTSDVQSTFEMTKG